jgi:hypothetical protein
MSEVSIFIIGAVIFAITVYGAVMAGGFAMQSVEHAENRRIYGDDGAPPPTGLD